MKSTLSFNLPEEREEFDSAVNGIRYKLALHDLDQWLRHKIKYEEISEAEMGAYEQAREELHKILSDDSLSLD